MSRRKMNRRTVAIVTAALALTACAGPQEPLSVGAKQLVADIKLGAEEPAPPPVRVDAPPTVPPFDAIPGTAFAPPPPPLSRNVAPPPPPAPRVPVVEDCPPFREDPRLRAGSAPAGYPSAGTYPFRVEGNFSRSGADATTGMVDGEAVTTIRDITPTPAGAPEPTGYTWVQETKFEGTTTATTYQVQTRQTEYAVVPGLNELGTNPRGVIPAGIYLAKVETTSAGQPTRTFNPPAPGLKLYEFDATRGVTFESAGTDPSTGETMAFTAVVGPAQQVNACGTAIDAVTVDLEGTLTWQRDTGRQVAEFTAKYSFALQFGGILIASKLSRSTQAVADGSTENLTVTTTINEEPADVSGPLPERVVDRVAP